MFSSGKHGDGDTWEPESETEDSEDEDAATETTSRTAAMRMKKTQSTERKPACMPLEFLHTDNAPIYVKGSDYTSGKSEKTDFCNFCQKPMLPTSLIRHFNAVHSHEPEVVKMNTTKKKTIERKRSVQILRNLGNFKRNTEVLRSGGELILVQRVKHSDDIANKLHRYAICADCVGVYPKEQFIRHRCPCINDTEHRESHLDTISSVSHRYPLEVVKFFKRMRNDEMALEAKGDDLLLSFLIKDLRKKGMHKFRGLAEKIRTLVRFLVKMRAKLENDRLTFAELFVPHYVEVMKKVVYEEFNFNFTVENSRIPVSMEKPSSVKRLCRALQEVAKHLEILFKKEGKDQMAKVTKTTLSILDDEFSAMTANATACLKSSKSGLPEKLPSSKEIQRLKEYFYWKEMKKTSARSVKQY